MMNDYSFIRLEPTLSKAIDTRPSSVASIFNIDQIQLLTNETYLQLSNVSSGIAFDGNYSVIICDCQGTELLNITNKVAIEEFIDFNGLPQIAFEITQIGTDFYKKPVTLKFSHTVSNAVWYSNLIIVSNYESYKTTRFDYRTIENPNFYQSIRLHCYFDRNDAEGESKEYTKIDGQKVNSTVILTEYENYIFERINSFTYRRLNKLLAMPIIYVNGYRVTNKQTLKSSERSGDTDLFGVDFMLAINYDETFTPFYQIFEPFNFDRLIPRDNNFFILASNPASISIRFNRNIIAGVGNVRIFKDGVLFDTIPQNELTFNDNEFIFANPIIANGEYYILISEGLVTSVFGESFSINDITVWNFSILAGEYSNANYNSEYLIN
jgi:hypothetical protein